MKTPEFLVIYAGHARYGRGPCFSDPALHRYDSCPEPCENWGEGTDKARWGLFRWGYPYIAIPASELISYGYTARPALSTVELRSKRLAAERHPDINQSRLEITTVDALVSQVAAVLRDLRDDIDENGPHRSELHEELDHLKISDPSDLRKYLDVAADATFWIQKAYYDVIWWKDAARKAAKVHKTYLLPHIVHVAGWTQTSVSPYDLGGTEIKCRCLCHFGCSTWKHNSHILKHQDYKNWRQEGNERYSYFTSASAYNSIANFFIYHILTFNELSAGRSWKKLLDHAAKNTNADLAFSNQDFFVTPDVSKRR